VTTPIDANLLLRHFTGDPPDQAARATAFIRQAAPRELLLFDLQVAECVYVLAGPYRQSRADVVRLLRSAMEVPAIEFERGPVINRALHLYLQQAMDFPDGYLVAMTENLGLTHVVGFDRFDAKLARASAVRRIEPPPP
jgi:predicted nucleic-acid-binding protein